MKTALLIFLSIYRYVLSPALHAFFGPGFGCRHQISCSRFAEKAVQKYPAYQALKLIFQRVSQCHPWKGFHEKH